MAINNGKLEGRITVPTGGWAFTASDDGGGPTTCTIPAGDYFISSADSTAQDFVAEFEKQLTDTMTATWTVTVSAGEAGTGLVKITNDDTLCSINAWTDTEVRDILGYTGALTGNSGATGYTSPNHVLGCWLPDVPKNTLFGDDTDRYETDARATESAAGHVKVLYGRKREILSSLEWPDCSLAKTRISGESTTNESFEKFWIDFILGEASYASNPGGPLRWHWDADDDATYKEVMVSGQLLRSFNPQQTRAGWTGRWMIRMGRLVVVP